MTAARQQTALLVTGGAGFIGSNFIEYLLAKYPSYFVINLDKLTYAASADFAVDPEYAANYLLVRGSICNAELVQYLFRSYDIRGVINFAAESHVDNSIANPNLFVETNVLGTCTLLNAALKHWMCRPGQVKPGYEAARFHHISTDEVFGALGAVGTFSELSPIAPNNPYSASKAGADLLVRSFHRTYGLNTVVTNCSNNYGPRQHDEKFIPTVIRSAVAHKPIPIYGSGQNVRDWLHVRDHAAAIDAVFHRGRSGETYSIGGSNEVSNLRLAELICEVLDEMVGDRLGAAGLTSHSELIRQVPDRPGHDFRYAVDHQKVTSELGWTPSIPFMDGLRQTVTWYLSRYQVQRSPESAVRVEV